MPDEQKPLLMLFLVFAITCSVPGRFGQQAGFFIIPDGFDISASPFSPYVRIDVASFNSYYSYRGRSKDMQ